mmetsp:Transcript_16249/g.38893  ORF Transcript_16249/g.38893 Transcript_16249/m.38893 type:complete len:84 (+) Transcript_16249:971-1222(+)
MDPSSIKPVVNQPVRDRQKKCTHIIIRMSIDRRERFVHREAGRRAQEAGVASIQRKGREGGGGEREGSALDSQAVRQPGRPVR